MTMTLEKAREEAREGLLSAASGLRRSDRSLGSKAGGLLKKAIGLLQEGELKGGLSALEQAMDLLDTTKVPFPPKLTDFLQETVHRWFMGGALYAILAGIAPTRPSEAEFGARQCIAALRFAERARLHPPRLTIEIRENSVETKEAVEKLKGMIRLFSIDDPFERWDALSDEISEAWPEGVSAEDAIREQRN